MGRFIDAVSERLEGQQPRGSARSLPARASRASLVARVGESCLQQVSGHTGVGDAERADTLAVSWHEQAYQSL
jgi:hypothetical protein